MGPPTKKRKIHVTAPEKIEFDPTAREEYLTGFHKRKVARQKFAADEIAKKEKEEKLRFRREVCHSIHSSCTHILYKEANSNMYNVLAPPTAQSRSRTTRLRSKPASPTSQRRPPRHRLQRRFLRRRLRRRIPGLRRTRTNQPRSRIHRRRQIHHRDRRVRQHFALRVFAAGR
jgi:hypothetical protein